MTDAVMEILKESGWNTYRKIDISEMLNILHFQGYVLTDTIKSILENFDGICVNFSKKKGNIYKKEQFEINVKKAVLRCDFKMADAYSKMSGEKLVPIGSACNKYMTVLVSQSGILYTEIDGMLLKHGNNFNESLNSIFVKDDIETIGSEDIYYEFLENDCDN